jgi:hypothetical protein
VARVYSRTSLPLRVTGMPSLRPFGACQGLRPRSWPHHCRHLSQPVRVTAPEGDPLDAPPPGRRQGGLPRNAGPCGVASFERKLIVVNKEESPAHRVPPDTSASSSSIPVVPLGQLADCCDANARGVNPLLRSMLFLANTWTRENAVFYRTDGKVLTEAAARAAGLSEEALNTAPIELADGVLTAYEVTAMNLQGPERVNLTACETGLGEVTPDGVVGLRQAFLLAGARALTMSMLEVQPRRPRRR